MTGARQFGRTADGQQATGRAVGHGVADGQQEIGQQEHLGGWQPGCVLEPSFAANVYSC